MKSYKTMKNRKHVKKHTIKKRTSHKGGFGKPGMPVGKAWKVGTIGRNHYSVSKIGRPNGFIDPPISTRGANNHVGGYKYKKSDKKKKRRTKKTRKNKTRSNRK